MDLQIKDALESLGLLKNEVLVYTDLVKNGDSSALEISKRTKIHRSNTYGSLRSLIQKGLVNEKLSSNKKFFSAIDPSGLKDYLKKKTKEKKEKIEEVIPMLNAFSGENEKVEESISLLEGTFSAREALSELLEKGMEFVSYGLSREVVNSLSLGFLKEFNDNRIKKKISAKYLFYKGMKDRAEKMNKKDFTEAKYISDKYWAPVSTSICGNFVLIIVFANPILTIKIRNKKIAESYKKHFDVLWKQGKK